MGAQVVALVFSSSAREAAVGVLIRKFRALPGVAGAVAAEQEKVLADIEEQVREPAGPDIAALEVFTQLPERGLSAKAVSSILDVCRNAQTMYDGRKAFGGIYHDSTGKVSKATMEAYKTFVYTNALYPTLFPVARKCEAEVVAMSVATMNGGPDACGTMTSGGTESLVMAVKAYRELALKTRGITAPEMVIPITAHPALNKGAHHLGVKLVNIPVGDDMRADLDALAAALNGNTIMAVGSAPGYPHGTIDPISEMAAIASARGIPFHVDSCLGGYLLPFLKRAGRLTRDFDFEVEGVTSISADLHKYGCAHKGASVILYADPEVRRCQYFQATSWPGGLYCSPSFSGSRAGGVIAAAWAAMVSMGMDGYMDAANACQDVLEALVEGINAIPGLYVISDPDAAIVAFASSEFSIHQLADEMPPRGWDLTRLIKPDCVHWAIGGRQFDLVKPMLDDLAECADIVRAHPERASEGMAGVYGMAGTLPDRTVVDEILSGYMDVILKP